MKRLEELFEDPETGDIVTRQREAVQARQIGEPYVFKHEVCYKREIAKDVMSDVIPPLKEEPALTKLKLDDEIRRIAPDTADAYICMDYKDECISSHDMGDSVCGCDKKDSRLLPDERCKVVRFYNKL